MVDDFDEIRDSVKDIIEHRMPGALVRTAKTGLEALEGCRERPPDLLVVDLKLPDIPGIEVLSEVKRTHRATRVLVLSADGSRASVKAAFEAGADGFALKRIALGELVEAVAQVLAGQPFVGSELRRRHPDLAGGWQVPDPSPGA